LLVKSDLLFSMYTRKHSSYGFRPTMDHPGDPVTDSLKAPLTISIISSVCWVIL